MPSRQSEHFKPPAVRLSDVLDAMRGFTLQAESVLSALREDEFSAADNKDFKDLFFRSQRLIRLYSAQFRRIVHNTSIVTPKERANNLIAELVDLKISEPSLLPFIQERLSSSFEKAAPRPISTVADFTLEGTTYPIIPSGEVMPLRERRKRPAKRWMDRDKSRKVTPPEFIKEIYKDRLGKGFTRADLAQTDPSLYQALHQWLQKADKKTDRRNRIPPDVDIPTIEEWNARRLAQQQAAPWSIDDQERVRLAKVQAARTIRSTMTNRT